MRRTAVFVLLMFAVLGSSADDAFKVQVLKTWTEAPRGHHQAGQYVQNRVRELGSGREYVLYCWEPKPQDHAAPCYLLKKGETYTARREHRSTYVSIPMNGAPVWAEYIEATNDWKL